MGKSEMNQLKSELRNQLKRELRKEMREELFFLNRRIEELENWRNDIIRRRIEFIEEQRRIRELEERRWITMSRNFSTLVAGFIDTCHICLQEEIANYHQCNRCNNKWCLSCHSRINRCPFWRN